MSYRSQIRQARLDARAESQALVSELRSASAALREERASYQREKAGRDAERAERWRRGEDGPELQRIQRRIDAGETTWDDVVSGRDEHPSAQTVRERITDNLDQLAEALAEDPEFVAEADRVRDLNDQIDRR
ncbi:hypothetical protein [Nocardioides insulae]|uniref:hypothetical protein n=1 Tax=Nocardioides insulae TaxID=394734 RepID=UPI0003F779AF|nr:hypothetical protein [Nocardioides insulae]